MGSHIAHLPARLLRLLMVAALGAAIVGPLHDAAFASSEWGSAGAGEAGPGRTRASRAAIAIDQVTAPVAPRGFVDDGAKVSFDPPVGWIREPPRALNPQSDPPDPAQELVRFQLRTADPSLYEQPIPITSALIRDAGAIISIGLARAGGELIDLDVDPRADRADATTVAGFFLIEDERTYEGLHVLTRYFIARATDRRIVARAVTAEEDWAALALIVRASLNSLRADPSGPNAPPAPPPAPAIELLAPAPAEPQSTDASLEVRRTIIERAAWLLSTPYVWGGNTANRAMDCSSYVSMAWGVARYTTESIGWVSEAISKADLRPGDAMNLMMGRDPEGYGHIRMFEAWANEAHTLVWVYEETPPRAVHRVVVYDDRYQPIRLVGLSNAGQAPLVLAPAPAPEPAFVPTQARNGGNGTPTARPTRQPSTPRPIRTPVPTRTPVPLGVLPTARPVIPVTPSPTSSIRLTPRPTRTPLPTLTPHR